MHATMEAKAENLQVSIQYQRLMWVNGAGGVRGEKKDKGNKRKCGEKFMLHISKDIQTRQRWNVVEDGCN